MADYFANRYWAQRYWPVRYFQGGQETPGAISASLTGSANVTAAITENSDLFANGGGFAFVRRIELKPDPEPAFIKASIFAAGSMDATATATANLSSAQSGKAELQAAVTYKYDWATADNDVWLLAA